METKKNPKFDLESKRSTFFFYGLIVSMTLVLFAFKNGKEVTAIDVPEMRNGEEITDIFIPPTIDREVEKRVAPPVLKLFDKINIVENSSLLPDPKIEFPEPGDPYDLPVIDAPIDTDDAPLIFAEQMPEFPGGTASLNKWLSRNINYPETAVNLGLHGRVYLNFVVDKNGSISDIKVTRGVDEILDKEAIRVISEMPKWKPGRQNGQPVKVAYNIYISFQLNK